MVDGLLYISTGLGTAAALDPTTGRVAWFDLPPGQTSPAGEPPIGRDELVSGGGAAKRGLAYWTDGSDARVFAITASQLVALNKSFITTSGIGMDRHGGRVHCSVDPVAGIRPEPRLT
jgi:outer membrane protein assembly factor BamB